MVLTEIRIGDRYRWPVGNVYEVTRKGTNHNDFMLTSESTGNDIEYQISLLRKHVDKHDRPVVKISIGEGEVIWSNLTQKTHTVHCGTCNAAWPEFAGEVPRSTCMACGSAL